MIQIDIISFIAGIIVGGLAIALITAEACREWGYDQGYRIGFEMGRYRGKKEAVKDECRKIGKDADGDRIRSGTD